jgi:TonB family protein
MPKRATAVNKPKSAETTPVPKKQKTASEPKKQEENTNDLSELLDAVPTIKVSEIASSQNFKYHWYLQNVVSKVEEQWKPPLGLTEKKDAAVIVSFTILQNGNISDVSVATSSSVSTLDNLAMRAIQLAAPFGKLPIGFTDDRLDITYTLHYVK